MSDLREDPTRGHWVLLRLAGEAPPASRDCPFCPGSESRTPPEIVAYRKDSSASDGPGWSVRGIVGVQDRPGVGGDERAHTETLCESRLKFPLS
jgi:hypothetical protein